MHKRTMSVLMIDMIEKHEEEMSILRTVQLQLRRQALGYMVLCYWRQYKRSALLAERSALQHDYELDDPFTFSVMLAVGKTLCDDPIIVGSQESNE